jgi:tetratricopeptide (TPR) repeat protein
VWAVRGWYGSLGGTSNFRQELKRAASEAEIALKLDPSHGGAHAATAVYAVAYHWHAHLLAAQGRLDVALAALERSIALDPLSFVTLVIYASQLNFARRYEDVLAITDRALALRSTVIAPLYGARAAA